MRFASLNNSNAQNYAQAGKEASNALADSFSIMRKTGPDYAMLSKVAMATRSAEKVASLEAQGFVGSKGLKALGDVTTAGIKARTGVKGAEMKADRIRKAGKVAAIGGILGGVVLAATNKKEDNSWKDKYEKQRDAINQAYLKTLDSDDAGSGTTEFKPIPFDQWRKQKNGGFNAQGGPAHGGSTGQSLPKGNTDNLQGTFSGGSLDTESVNAIRATAKRLGVDPYSLGGLIELESGHKPNIWGGAGGNYRGLIQFGPGARSEVGLPGGDMTIAQQMPYVEKYFQQRGFKPGQHGVTELYRTVLVGNPGQSGTDSFGTNSDSAAKRMMPGGDLYKRARSLYGGL